jgi:hypothetical protein
MYYANRLIWNSNGQKDHLINNTFRGKTDILQGYNATFMTGLTKRNAISLNNCAFSTTRGLNY